MRMTKFHRTRCVDGRLMRHDPQHDDPDLETDIGTCQECEGNGCPAVREGRRRLAANKSVAH